MARNILAASLVGGGFLVAGKQQVRREHRQRRCAHQTRAALEKLPARLVADIILKQRMRLELGENRS